ncbi:hypothetical protein G647_04007 [Cladophialophora carrionii CBS 160.54]|uniref:Uncharacterized protein n=1 Tax=Cladophialophora carrionii CBS 160.54 TaxID=1279043 RepID=V9DE81_9EURO|nr:uncharacterized protein G647_04007 [Cladophialophora carrionii CBS 160.54]ETI24638.1 hypothetical protein G647_04007 [Cladophialophora carrionii CBS 160.54]
MSDIAKGVGNLITSIVEIIKGIFGTFINAIQGIFVTVFNVFQGALNAVIGLVRNTFNLAEGAVGFIIGNFFILGTLAAIYFGYQLLQQRQGNRPAPISKAVTGKTQ